MKDNLISYDTQFKKVGFFIKTDFFERQFCQDILYEQDALNKSKSNIVNINYKDIKRNYKLLKAYSEINKFLKTSINYDFYLSNLKYITTYQNHPKNDLPYIPHIDKNRYLKVFVYLHDVDGTDGPLTISENSDMIKNENRRIDFWKSAEKNEYQLVFGDKSICTPQIFKAGTIIIIDTNVSHLAGEVKKDRFRKILRFTFNFLHKNQNSLTFKFNKYKFYGKNLLTDMRINS